MKSFITKLKAALIESKVAKKPHDHTFTEAIINDVEGAPFAISETNVLYAGLSELAGYHYLKTIIIGSCQIKTFHGAKLLVNGIDFKLELTSDMVELTSEASNIPNRNITRIDFEIDSDDISKISKHLIESLEIIAKKNHLKFSTIEGNYDEELSDKNLEEKEEVEEIILDQDESHHEE